MTRFLVCLWCFLFAPVLLSAEETKEYIAIRKQGSGRISIVLDKTGAKGGKEGEWAKSLDAIIHDGLDFTGLFNLVAPPLNIRDAKDPKNVVINFAAVNSVGAEVYTGGAVTKKSGNVNLDMEVYDALGGKLLLRKLYTGKDDQLRTIGHAFCADLVELLTGKRSVFGSKIVYVSNKSGFKEIYQSDFDGANPVQITNSKSISLTPAISPDGQYMAYTDYTGGRPELHFRRLSDSKIVRVVKNGVSIDPAWRHGSNECATTLSFEGDQEIYLVKPDGIISRRLTFSKGIDVSPSFSPDGSKMAFVSQRNGMPQIFIQDIQSGAVRRLTFSGNYNTQPAWSPNGDKIAYSTWQKNGEINIFVINPDGTGLIQLTRGEKDNEAPSWSPDGSMIVFSSNRQGRKKLFVMNSDGTNQRRLLQMEGDQQQPSWFSFR
jgi:TolB protein